MLPIHLFRQNKELILEGLKKKNFKEPELVDQIIALDEHRRRIQVENDAIAASINAASKNIGQLMAKGNKEESEQLKAQVATHKDQAKYISKSWASWKPSCTICW
jgi:seryl-tRNA synthetase